MKRMLINATQAEELRMAMVDGQRLYDLNIEGPASERKKANIYKGKITRVEPSLEAAFVDYGAERHGFLPLKEVSSEYFLSEVESGKKPNIRDVLKEGQDIVVQIDKEERGNKGAALTTFVSLAGRFIVLKPNKARSGGVSRRIVGDDRDLARESLHEIEIPKGMSVILRTAGIDRSPEELAWDLETLMKVWQAILDHVLRRPAPFLLYRESNSVIRALRDYLTNEIGEILIDDEATYKEALEFVEQVMPHNAKKLKYYSDAVPLFTRYQIETQIETAFAHKVTLPSGGSIVIDHTEALVSIDINSARATKGGDIEATALNTNLEASEEIARQLRIRDLGGLVVIDFIDMGPQKNQREVENRLRDSVRQDRARVQIGKITRFGLLEMSRQRLRPSIGESAYQTCPRCSGFGTIRSIESLALAILRIVGEEVRKERTAKVIAQLPVEVATYLLNEKRDWVQDLESSHDTQVVLIANAVLETPHYDIRRVRDDQTDLPENTGVSYSLAHTETLLDIPQSIEERAVAEQAAIDVITPSTPAPAPARPKTGGFWAWLTGLFAGSGETKPAKKPARQRGKGKTAKTRERGSARGGRKRNDQRQQSGDRKRPARKTSKKKSDSSKPADRSRNRKQAAKDPSAQQQAKAQEPSKKDEARDEQSRPARSRRSRGGRRRRRGADRPASETAENRTEQTQGQDKEQPQRTKAAARDASRPAEDAQKAGAPPGQAIEREAQASKPVTRSPETAAAASENVPAGKAVPKSGEAATSGNGSSAAAQSTPPVTPAPKPAATPAPTPAESPAPKPPASTAPKSAESPTPRPAESPAPRPAESPAPKSAESPAPRPAESPAPKSVESPTPRPAESPAPKSAESPAPRPAESPAPKSAESLAPKPAATTPAANKPPETSTAKPEGRLLPWDAPAADAPAKPADSPDQG